MSDLTDQETSDERSEHADTSDAAASLAAEGSEPSAPDQSAHQEVRYLYLNDHDDLTRLCWCMYRAIWDEQAATWDQLDEADQQALHREVQAVLAADGNATAAFRALNGQRDFSSQQLVEQHWWLTAADTVRAVIEARRVDPGARVHES